MERAERGTCTEGVTSPDAKDTHTVRSSKAADARQCSTSPLLKRNKGPGHGLSASGGYWFAEGHIFAVFVLTCVAAVKLPTIVARRLDLVSVEQTAKRPSRVAKAYLQSGEQLQG